jgi:hypothetical protein
LVHRDFDLVQHRSISRRSSPACDQTFRMNSCKQAAFTTFYKNPQESQSLAVESDPVPAEQAMDDETDAWR